MEPFVLRAVRAIPRLKVRAGDCVIFDPDGPALLTRWRPTPVPNIGAALLAYELGALEPAGTTTPPSASELRGALAIPDELSSRQPEVQEPLRIVR